MSALMGFENRYSSADGAAGPETLLAMLRETIRKYSEQS